MIQALAPRLRWGCSLLRSALVLAVLAVWAGLVQAQPPATKEAAPAPKEEPAAQAPAEEPEQPASVGGTVETFKDPRAEKALGIFKSVPGLRDCRPTDVNQVKAMAATAGAVDRALVQRFVEGMAYRLTDKSNINGLIAPPPGTSPNSMVLRAVKESVDNLLAPIFTARAVRNTGFLQVYNQVLLATLPKLLDNNLVARLEAMIVLGQAGDPAAMPVFLAQLKDADQTVWVKLWAARGIYNMVDGGARVDQVLSVQAASTAAKALADFLDTEKEAPWPAQVRALEAIGAMRQAAQPTSLGKADMAVVVMRFLTDEEATPEVRSAAAWALGMMRVNPAASGYNFQLVALHIGQLAAGLATDAADSFPAPKVAAKEETTKAAGKEENEVDVTQLQSEVSTSNRTLSEYLAALLVSQLYQSLNGVADARDSGLAKQQNLGQAAAFVKQIADLQSTTARAAVQLVRGTPGQYEANVKELRDRVAALTAALEKAPIKDFHLVPGGAIEFKPAASEAPAAADAAAPAAKADAAAPAGKAGAPGGR